MIVKQKKSTLTFVILTAKHAHFLAEKLKAVSELFPDDDIEFAFGENKDGECVVGVKKYDEYDRGNFCQFTMKRKGVK